MSGLERDLPGVSSREGLLSPKDTGSAARLWLSAQGEQGRGSRHVWFGWRYGGRSRFRDGGMGP